MLSDPRGDSWRRSRLKTALHLRLLPLRSPTHSHKKNLHSQPRRNIWHFHFFFSACLLPLPCNYRHPMIFRAVSLCFSQIAINPPGYKERERPPPPHTHAHTEFPLVSMSGASWSRRFLIKKMRIKRKTEVAEIDDRVGMRLSICV